MNDIVFEVEGETTLVEGEESGPVLYAWTSIDTEGDERDSYVSGGKRHTNMTAFHEKMAFRFTLDEDVARGRRSVRADDILAFEMFTTLRKTKKPMPAGAGYVFLYEVVAALRTGKTISVPLRQADKTLHAHTEEELKRIEKAHLRIRAADGTAARSLVFESSSALTLSRERTGRSLMRTNLTFMSMMNERVRQKIGVAFDEPPETHGVYAPYFYNPIHPSMNSDAFYMIRNSRGHRFDEAALLDIVIFALRRVSIPVPDFLTAVEDWWHGAGVHPDVLEAFAQICALPAVMTRYTSDESAVRVVVDGWFSGNQERGSTKVGEAFLDMYRSWKMDFPTLMRRVRAAFSDCEDDGRGCARLFIALRGYRGSIPLLCACARLASLYAGYGCEMAVSGASVTAAKSHGDALPENIDKPADPDFVAAHQAFALLPADTLLAMLRRTYHKMEALPAAALGGDSPWTLPALNTVERRRVESLLVMVIEGTGWLKARNVPEQFDHGVDEGKRRVTEWVNARSAVVSGRASGLRDGENPAAAIGRVSMMKAPIQYVKDESEMPVMRNIFFNHFWRRAVHGALAMDEATPYENTIYRIRGRGEHHATLAINRIFFAMRGGRHESVPSGPVHNAYSRSVAVTDLLLEHDNAAVVMMGASTREDYLVCQRLLRNLAPETRVVAHSTKKTLEQAAPLIDGLRNHLGHKVIVLEGHAPEPDVGPGVPVAMVVQLEHAGDPHLATDLARLWKGDHIHRVLVSAESTNTGETIVLRPIVLLEE